LIGDDQDAGFFRRWGHGEPVFARPV
jgi:hypothetical protein